MKIIKTVIVKQVLTSKRKQELLEQLLNEKKQLQKELEQLKFQMQKKIKNQDRTTSIAQSSFQKEISKREEKLHSVDFKVHQLNKLEIGTELREGTIQALEEIQVGDDWDDFQVPTEIIIKDGKVHEIRKGRSEHDELV